MRMPSNGSETASADVFSSRQPERPDLNLTPSFQIDPEQATPMMKQFLGVKQSYPGVILLYRMGDFYETFFEDALIAAKALEITLTARDAGSLGKIPMAGVPVKAADVYIQRLLEKQFKVAICEQVGDPAQSKGLMERRVARVLSKGTLLDNGLLKPDESNYLAALYPAQADVWGLAWCEVTTGHFYTTVLSQNDMLNELDRLRPAEILVPGKKVRGAIVDEWQPNVPEAISASFAQLTPLPSAYFQLNVASDKILSWFQVPSLESFGLQEDPDAVIAAGLILQYLESTYLEEARPAFERLQRVGNAQRLEMTISCRRNLELLQTQRSHDTEGSLLWLLDRTETPMGGRLLREWIVAPSLDLFEINSRLDTVETLVQHHGVLKALQPLLGQVYDLERLAMKLGNGTILPRECLAILRACQMLPHLSDCLRPFESVYYLGQLTLVPPGITSLATLIQAAIADNAPMSVREGGIFKASYHPEVARLRDLTENQATWQVQYEEQERARTGLKNLKLGFNHAFGFYIEISKAQAKDAPPDYHRKQTLTNAERFITPELKAHEAEVMTASQTLLDLEASLFNDLRQQLLNFAPVLLDLSKRLAVLDVLQSFASVSLEYQYVRPLIDDSQVLSLVESRHPVLEKRLNLGQYVANDVQLDAADGTPALPQVMIITGPNMAGKSTYMRQVALCVVMGQMGCFVPARSARFGLVDKLFTRIGAVDDLGRGQSTFMVEMVEVAEVLHCATERSLVILDEVGRGTSTFDGVSIAWGIVEHLVRENKARTLFATHYHELNTLEHLHAKIQNMRVLVNEDTEGGLAFLYRVVPGAAQKSYGIQVARMAGLPSSVVQRAEALLAKIQEKDVTVDNQKRRRAMIEHANDSQLHLFK